MWARPADHWERDFSCLVAPRPSSRNLNPRLLLPLTNHADKATSAFWLNRKRCRVNHPREMPRMTCSRHKTANDGTHGACERQTSPPKPCTGTAIVFAFLARLSELPKGRGWSSPCGRSFLCIESFTLVGTLCPRTNTETTPERAAPFLSLSLRLLLPPLLSTSHLLEVSTPLPYLKSPHKVRDFSFFFFLFFLPRNSSIFPSRIYSFRCVCLLDVT